MRCRLDAGDTSEGTDRRLQPGMGGGHNTVASPLEEESRPHQKPDIAMLTLPVLVHSGKETLARLKRPGREKKGK